MTFQEWICIIHADVWQKLVSHFGSWNEIMRFNADQRHFQIDLHYYCRRVTKIVHPPCEVKKSMLFAGDQWKIAISIALLMQTYDKSCCHTLGGELQMFTGPQRNAYLFSRNFTLNEDSQLFSHVCKEMAIQIANVHWSPAGSILFFSEIHPWMKIHNFFHTSARKWPSRLQMFTGPLREAYFFSRKFTPECWRRFRIIISMVSSVGTPKSIRRVSKIVHLPKSMIFFIVISNTLSVVTLKSIRRSAKIGHLKSRRWFYVMFSTVWSFVTLLES